MLRQDCLDGTVDARKPGRLRVTEYSATQGQLKPPAGGINQSAGDTCSQTCGSTAEGSLQSLSATHGPRIHTQVFTPVTRSGRSP